MTAGQSVISYDVPAIVAAGLNPVVPVVVMDEREASNIAAADAVITGAQISTGAILFSARK